MYLFPFIPDGCPFNLIKQLHHIMRRIELQAGLNMRRFLHSYLFFYRISLFSLYSLP